MPQLLWPAVAWSDLLHVACCDLLHVACCDLLHVAWSDLLHVAWSDLLHVACCNLLHVAWSDLLHVAWSDLLWHSALVLSEGPPHPVRQARSAKDLHIHVFLPGSPRDSRLQKEDLHFLRSMVLKTSSTNFCLGRGTLSL